MKIKPPPRINNAHVRILRQFGHWHHTLTPTDVMKMIYATSKQPMKKIAGLQKQMDYLARHGFLVKWPRGFCITPSGLDARKKDAGIIVEIPMMRLVGGNEA